MTLLPTATEGLPMSVVETARVLMETPTAPTQEQWLAAVLRGLLRAIRGLSITQDRWGNIFARLRRGANPPRCVAYVAHMDHPGFAITRIEPGGRVVHGTFEGGVKDEYFPGSPVRLFRSDNDAGVTGRVRQAGPFRFEHHSREVILDMDADATAAVLGMWDLPAFDVREGCIHSRAIDDLGGCAMLVETLRTAAARTEDADLLCVFTRTEEAGFRGALLICKAPDADRWLPRDAWVISVETSSARPSTPIGEGAILRVGDKDSIFNPDITRAISDISATIAQRDGSKPLRRALMDGGTCEATCFNLYGWVSGAVCVPLGNYHNMNPATGKIDAEFISIADAESLVATMAALALHRDAEGKTATERLKEQMEVLAAGAADKIGEWPAEG